MRPRREHEAPVEPGTLRRQTWLLALPWGPSTPRERDTSVPGSKDAGGETRCRGRDQLSEGQWSFAGWGYIHRALSTGHQPGSLRMKLICPDFPRKVENLHLKRLAACQAQGWVTSVSSNDLIVKEGVWVVFSCQMALPSAFDDSTTFRVVL